MLKYAVEDKDLIEELKEMQEDGAKQEDAFTAIWNLAPAVCAE